MMPFSNTASLRITKVFWNHAPSPTHPLPCCVVVVSQLIAALQSEQARLSNLLTETTSNLETQLSNERGVSKAREDDLEVASEQLEMAQVRMVVVEG